jgi:hypothetical protein
LSRRFFGCRIFGRKTGSQPKSGRGHAFPENALTGVRAIGILDIFTGDAGKQAADRSRRLLTQTQDDIAGRTNAARDEAARLLAGGYGAARRRLADYDSAARGAIDNSAAEARANFAYGAATARDLFGGARNDVTAGYRSLADLGTTFTRGADLYSDAMGLNGPEGTARANAAFEAGPGYAFARDQGLDAISRRRNAVGGTALAGNADADAARFVSGLAYQNFADWRNALAPYNNFALTTGQAAADRGKTLAGLGTTEAGTVMDAARARAALETGRGNSLADIANRYFGGLAGFDTAEGGALAGNVTNAANALNSAALSIAPQLASTYKDEAAAELAGSKAFWDALMGGANLALKASGLGGFAPSGAK